MSNSVYTTHDLSIAAFLLMKGETIISVDKNGPRGRYVFEFDNSSGHVEAIAMQFLSSECAVYDSHLRTLRGMLNKP
jgi:hypothetical protein